MINKILKSNKNLSEKLNFLNHDTSLVKPYYASTNGVDITVWPEFIDNKLSGSGDIFIWAYHVRIENKSLENVKLISRYWQIIDEEGNIQEIRGEGVVGEKPLINANSSYKYSSGVHLEHSSGIMMGHFLMKKDDGSFFEAKIPNFSLDAPNLKGVIN